MTNTQSPDEPSTQAYPGDVIRYAGYFVYHRTAATSTAANRTAVADEITALTGDLASRDIVTRGFYDLSGMRADADLMIWWHAPTAEALQAATREFRATAAGARLAPTWSAVGLHRLSEFNKAHVPAFIAGRRATDWVAVYPYRRTAAWYLLPPNERGALLGEHGKLGRDYPAVQNNTVSAFALGDYEWILAVESDQLDQIVDLMRHLRVSGTRRYVELEVPFFTGRRIDPAGVAEVLA